MSTGTIALNDSGPNQFYLSVCLSVCVCVCVWTKCEFLSLARANQNKIESWGEWEPKEGLEEKEGLKRGQKGGLEDYGCKWA